MLDIAQIALQNDLFIASGIGFFLNLPFVRPYWSPAIHSKPLPKQSPITPRSEAPITQIVTIVPQPVTIVQEPITLRPTQTVYGTVTKKVTSISLVVNEQVVTKRRCLPTDPTAPRATFIEYSEVCTPPKETCAHCPRCAPLLSSKPASAITSAYPEASCAPCAPCAPLSSAESVPPIMSTSLGAWATWALFPLVVIAMGAIFLIFRPNLINKSIAKAEDKAIEAKLALKAKKKFHQEWKTKACDYSAELKTSQREVRDLLKGIEERNDMLKLLGVFADGDQIVDEETLYQMVRERKAYLTVDAGNMRRLEAENTARAKKIRELKAENASMKEQVKDLHSDAPKPDKFQELLDDKQREINIWRNAALGNDPDATFRAIYQRCEEKDAELQKLRILPTEINELEQALNDASKQIETLQQEKKDQGIADRQRWNKEKEDLCKTYTKAIKALKDDLKEAQRSSTPSKSAPRKMVKKKESKDSEDTAANKLLLVGLEAEQNTVARETMNLLSQHAMNEEFSVVSRMLKEVEKERDEYKKALEDAESRYAAENKQLREDFEVAQNFFIKEKMDLDRDEHARKQQVSEVQEELEEVKKDLDELRKEFKDLNTECNELEMDLEDHQGKNTTENVQRYSDLKAEQNSIGMEVMTLHRQMYDIQDMVPGASRDFQKGREVCGEL